MKFTYRVAGVALHEQHVLLQSSSDTNFWFMPGGRAEMLESAHTTIHREMLEELGVEVHIERLLWLVENFFVYRGRAGHELALYFLITIPPLPHLYRRDAPFKLPDEQGTMLTYNWFPLDKLDTITVYPTFLRHKLQHLSDEIEHIVHTDEESVAGLERYPGM